MVRAVNSGREEAILQDAAKFCRMRNFATCKIFAVLHFLCIFFSSFLMVFDLQC